MAPRDSEARNARPDDIVALESAPASAAIFQLARTHKAYAAQLLRRLDLHPGQEILLMELSRVGHRTQGELVRTLMVDHSTIAKSLKRLQDAGLVTRRPSPDDRRVVLVSLTDAGAALVTSVEAVWAELEAVTTSALSPKQQRALVEIAAIAERSVAEAMRTPTGA